MSNPHQELARWKKAGAIADYLESLARKLTMHTARPFNDQSPADWAALIRTVEATSEHDWRAVSVMAGQRPASVETQKVVLEILRGRMQAAGVDPFAGVSP